MRAVYNEIEVAPNESAWNSTKDAWITSEVRSSLVFSNVRSVNYNVETADRSVYLIGSARSQAELDHATDLARNVSGCQAGRLLCRGPAGCTARFAAGGIAARRRLPPAAVRQPGSAPCPGADDAGRSPEALSAPSPTVARYFDVSFVAPRKSV